MERNQPAFALTIALDCPTPAGAGCSLSVTQPLDSSHLIETAERRPRELRMKGARPAPLSPIHFRQMLGGQLIDWNLLQSNFNLGRVQTGKLCLEHFPGSVEAPQRG